ncbi:MAG TPA: hypothetical protein DDW81_00945 [Cryomorphaceae bacterium]|nr:hypothetical protein [Owenweeksia sp.]HBF18628.1 hypothetical protein [Cryomorphaceae bacterium]|tara:strand:+ start:7432 stop:8796 length:1365 start_codon:yes stop_codon:yes gene_type:complete
MLKKYFPFAAIVALLLPAANVYAQTEEDVEKDTRINITVTRNGETHHIEIDPENVDNLKEVMEQVPGLEDVELSTENGNIEVIVRSDEDGSLNHQWSMNKHARLFSQDLHTEPRPFLGVVGHHSQRGVYLQKIIPGSAAEKAGLQEGDIILEMDGQKPDSYKAFTEAIKAKKAGDELRLKIDRNGKTQNATATLEETKNHLTQWSDKDFSGDMSTFLDQLELEGVEFPSSDRGYLGVEFDMKGESGVHINKVVEESPAAKAGLQVGDIIKKVDGKPVTEGPEFMHAMQQTQKGQEVELQLERNGATINQKVELGEWKTRALRKVYMNKVHHDFFGDGDIDFNISVRVEHISDTEKQMVNKSLGLKNNKNFNDIDTEVYPNPGNGNYSVKVHVPGVQEMEVIVLDQSGKEVMHRKLRDASGSFEADVNISDKANGMYFLVLKSGDRTQVEKLIKE